MKTSESNRSIRQQMLFSISIVLLLTGVTSVLFLNGLLNRFRTKQSEDIQAAHRQALQEMANNKKAEYESLFKAETERAMDIASLFSQSSIVIDAYRLAYTGDVTNEDDEACRQARAKLKAMVKRHESGYTDATGRDSLGIHFHLPPARSLARTWRDGWQTQRDGKKVDISDDLSSFRETVRQVNTTGKPVQGIEVGSGGLVIRGIVPVKDEDGRQLGSVETLRQYTPLLNAVKSGGEQLALYMHVSQLATAEAMRDAKAFPPFGPDYILAAATDTKTALEKIAPTDLEKSLESAVSIIKNDLFLTLLPVNDFSGRKVAVLAMAFDMTSFQIKQAEDEKKARIENGHIRNIAIGAVIVVIAVVLGIIVIVVNRINRRLAAIADNLRGGADQIKDAATQVAGSSNALAQGASQQAAGLQEASSSLKEITAMTRQNAATAGTTERMARETQLTAEQGARAMRV